MEGKYFDKRQVRKETCVSHIGAEEKCDLLPAVPEVAAEFGISRRQVHDVRKDKGKWIDGHLLAMRKTVLRRDERNRGSP